MIEKASGKVLNSAAMNIIERGKEEVMEKLDKADKLWHFILKFLIPKLKPEMNFVRVLGD